VADDGVLRLRITVDGANTIPEAMAKSAVAVRQASDEIADAFSSGVRSAAADADDFGKLMDAPVQQITYNMHEARGAVQLLGEQIGIRLPREVNKLVSEVPAIGSVMSAAFSTIAVVGFIQVLAEVPEAFDKISQSVTGWDEEAKKAYDHQIDINQKYLDLIRETARAQQELRLVGKTGSDEKKTELEVERSEQARNTQELHDNQVKLAGDMKALADLEEKSGFHLRDLLNPGMRLFANHIEGTSEEMKRLQNEIKATTDRNVELDIAIRKSSQQTQPKVKAEEGAEKIKEDQKAADERAAIEKRFREVTQEINLKHQQETLAAIQKVNEDEEKATADRLKRGFDAVEESGRIIDQYNAAQRAKEKQETQHLLNDLDGIRNQEIQDDIARREKIDANRLRDYQKEQAELRAQQKWVNGYLNGIDQQFNQHVMRWVTGQETIKQSLENSWNSIATNAIQNLARMAEQQLLYHALGIALEKKGILADAKAAGARAFTNVMKALPFPADVIMAPIAAAGAFTAVAAFGSFDQGGIVPNTGMHMLHAKEMVLPADISAGLQSAFGGGQKVQRGGDVVLHYTANGAGSAADHKRNAADIVKIIKREQRRGALPAV
jgi:hypothetical protein